jgi:hypothetical protein
VVDRADGPGRSKGRRGRSLVPWLPESATAGLHVATTARFSQFASRADSGASDETMSSARDSGDDQRGCPRCQSCYACSEQGGEGDPVHAPPSALGETDPYARRASVRPVPPTAVRTCPAAPTNRQPWPSGANAATSFGGLVRRFVEGHDVIISRLAAP